MHLETYMLLFYSGNLYKGDADFSLLAVMQKASSFYIYGHIGIGIRKCMFLFTEYDYCHTKGKILFILL